MGRTTFKGPVNSENGFEVDGSAVVNITQQDAITSLTDSTGATAIDTLVAVGDTSASDVSDSINDNFASLNAVQESILTALRSAGIIGS